jgi:hypothetical protein
VAPDRAVAEAAGPEVLAREPGAGEPVVPVVPEPGLGLAGPGRAARVAAARALA